MPLTEYEKLLVVRRAWGEYAISNCIRKLVTEQRKNRTLEDRPFLEFARLTVKSSYSMDELIDWCKMIVDKFGGG